MEGWIIYNKFPGETLTFSRRRFIEVALQENIKLEFFTPEQFDIIVNKDDKKSIRVDWKIRKLPDFVIPRMWAWTTYFAFSVLRHLQKLWVYILNSPDSIEIVKDKLHSFQVLASHNLPIPKTMLAKFPINIDLIEEEIWFPVVIKTLSWSKWSWVFLSEDKKNFSNTMNMIEKVWNDKNLIFQKFIQASIWKDLRVFVIWWRVVWCMQRNWVKWDFRANYSLWWSVNKFEVTPEIEWLWAQCANVLWLDVAWIDLLFDEDHFKICEANSSPWFNWFESCVDVNIPKEIFDYIRFRLWIYD